MFIKELKSPILLPINRDQTSAGRLLIGQHVIAMKMKHLKLSLILLLISGFLQAQNDTIILHQALSKYNTITFTRIISYSKADSLYHVRDYFQNGQIEMDAYYSSLDKHIKEEMQCNYRTNTKNGPYRERYKNGRMEYRGYFKNGLRNGLFISWYNNGQKEGEEHWLNGRLNGKTKYWTKTGKLQFNLTFRQGLNLHPKNVRYHYIVYLPPGYHADTTKKWPLIIYLHGGAERGTDTLALYAAGPFDQINRGRKFKFIIASPQCPKNIRWSTDNWFENFYNDITSKYRVDTNKIYLTGNSLGGAGTWYLAEKYPEKFAAIAPMCGFTSHVKYIDEHISNLYNMPIWAFHGEQDKVVPFEQTARMIKRLKGKNKDLRFTADPDVGHWIHWLVYPKQELYDWFLKHDKRLKKKN